MNKTMPHADLPPTEPLAMPLAVATFYRFCPMPDLDALQQRLSACAEALGLKGTVLLAEEGLNVTIAGPPANVEAWVSALRADEPFSRIPINRILYTTASAMPFGKLVVDIRPEVVTFREAGIQPAQSTGQHVAPEEWNALVDNPAIPVLDVRNDFEVQVGSFAGAVNPSTDNFTAFKQYVADNLDTLKAAPQVAMFCTGGIRCEKASAYLQAQGVPNVAQLEGGILNYLRAVPQANTRWHGECFVFDDRVTLTHELEEGNYRREKGAVLPKC